MATALAFIVVIPNFAASPTTSPTGQAEADGLGGSGHIGLPGAGANDHETVSWYPEGTWAIT
jgi:hypothetical protein